MNAGVFDEFDGDRVAPAVGCPTCGETRLEALDWCDPGEAPFPQYPHEYVWCRTCGTAYDPNRNNEIIGNSRLGIR